MKNLKKSKVKSTNSSRVYNFQKKSENSSNSSNSTTTSNLRKGFKPIKNPIPDLYSIMWKTKDNRDRTFFVLQDNKGRNTDYYLIKHEDVKLEEHQKNTVIEIARLLGWKKPLLATATTKYNQAVDFLEDNKEETLEGEHWEMIFNRINQLISVENNLQEQHDVAVEHHQHPERFIPRK